MYSLLSDFDSTKFQEESSRKFSGSGEIEVHQALGEKLCSRIPFIPRVSEDVFYSRVITYPRYNGLLVYLHMFTLLYEKVVQFNMANLS
jgi:hypothetical protein